MSMLNSLLHTEQSKQQAKAFLQLISKGQQRAPNQELLLMTSMQRTLPFIQCKLSLRSNSKLLFFFSLIQTQCLTQSKAEQYSINCHHLLHCWRKKENSQTIRKQQHGVPLYMGTHLSTTNMSLKHDETITLFSFPSVQLAAPYVPCKELFTVHF